MHKVYLKKTERQLDYATPEYLSELFLSLKMKYNIPINDAIRLLNEGRIDSISLSKNEPYFNFHATRSKNTIWMSIREAKQDIEFNVPLNVIVSLLTH